MAKKMKGGTKFILILIGIYLLLGVIYHMQNPASDWGSSLLVGGYTLIKGWLKF